VAFAQVLGLLLSGILAQALGIRPVFLASAGVLVLLSLGGFLMIRGKTEVAATAGS
jgi:hypothetical protein